MENGVAPISGCRSNGSRWACVSKRLLPSSALPASAELQLALDVRGVPQPRSRPIEALPLLRGADACRTGIDRCDGVARSFQVIEYNVEPSRSVRTRNLFANDNVRLALLNETEESGPEMTVVVEPSAQPGSTERLARKGCGPRPQSAARPSGLLECVGPDTDAGEPMDDIVAADIACRNFLDRPSVNPSSWKSSSCAEFPHPVRGERRMLVVVDFGVFDCDDVLAIIVFLERHQREQAVFAGQTQGAETMWKVAIRTP